MMEVLGIYFPMAIACLREMVWRGIVVVSIANSLRLFLVVIFSYLKRHIVTTCKLVESTLQHFMIIHTECCLL